MLPRAQTYYALLYPGSRNGGIVTLSMVSKLLMCLPMRQPIFIGVVSPQGGDKSNLAKYVKFSTGFLPSLILSNLGRDIQQV